jgi:hypothetical protein
VAAGPTHRERPVNWRFQDSKLNGIQSSTDQGGVTIWEKTRNEYISLDRGKFHVVSNKSMAKPAV